MALTLANEIEIENRNFVANKAITAITFKFSGNKGKSRVFIDSKEIRGQKIHFMLMLEENYNKILNWWVDSPNNPNNPKTVFEQYPPQPPTQAIFERETNIVDKEFEIENNLKYAWVLNNTNSILTSKEVLTKITINPLSEKHVPKENLTSYDNFKDKVPNELQRDLDDANNSYLVGHYRQCAIVLRTAMETAIRIKANQENFIDELIDKNGREIELSKKLDLLQTKNVILSNIKTEVETTTKKFGDWGVHSKTEIVANDIIKIVEPSFRNFLTALNLL